LLAKEEIIGAYGYINTWTGKKFYPLRPELLVVDINDIAHGLSHINRYGGHLDVDFYSVAQHSCLVEQLATEKFIRIENFGAPTVKLFRLQALLHDATEAYLGDIPKPIKEILPDYKRLESRLQKHIFDTFRLPQNVHSVIKEAERKLMVAEVANLSYGWDLNEFFGENEYSVEYIEMGINYWPPGKAKSKFLDKYNEISAS
jgi:5'-deoxynucleotidase YfbR-like HD superfamily hydrolase